MKYGSVCSGIEAATQAWHHMGWKPSFFSENDAFPCAVLQHHYPEVPLHGDFTTIQDGDYEPITFLSEELPVSPSQSLALEKDWMTRVATSCLGSVRLLNDYAPHGWYGRTSPASCQLTEEGILEPSSGCWQSSGMGSPTEFLTLSSSAWPKDASVCLLSDTLVTGDLPQRYFLSATACRGILRRAEKRKKTLPERLRLALAAVAGATA